MKNLAASIQANLKNYSKELGLDFILTTRLYMQEGLLRRISLSAYSDSFILKGGLLLYSLSGFSSRPTKDIDLLGSRVSNDESLLRKVLIEIFSIESEDGLIFDSDSLVFSGITEGADYKGKRVKITCFLGRIRTILKLDGHSGENCHPFRFKVATPGASYNT